MKPLFTIHAGEFLVASYIEQQFRDYLVWVPSRDSGVDLLLTDHDCKTAVSNQVKFPEISLPHTCLMRYDPASRHAAGSR